MNSSNNNLLLNGTLGSTTTSTGSPMMYTPRTKNILQSPRAQVKATVQISNKIIGSGASGNVFLGIHLTTFQLVAVKTVQLNVVEKSNPLHSPELADAGRDKSSKKQLEDLAAEVRLMKSLAHPSIVKFIGSERMGTQLNFYMEYMGGGSLSSVVEKFGPLNPAIVRHYMRQALQGIQYLHENDVFHRDIKPENLLIDGTSCKVSDFGTSRRIDANRQNKTLTGTPWYMAPEIAKGDAHDLKADIWSFGCTCAMLLTGKAPWSNIDNPTSVMFQIAKNPEACAQNVLKDMLTVSGGVPNEAKEVILACLKPNPAERPTAQQLLSDFAFFAAKDEKEML